MELLFKKSIHSPSEALGQVDAEITAVTEENYTSPRRMQEIITWDTCDAHEQALESNCEKTERKERISTVVEV